MVPKNQNPILCISCALKGLERKITVRRSVNFGLRRVRGGRCEGGDDRESDFRGRKLGGFTIDLRDGQLCTYAGDSTSWESLMTVGGETALGGGSGLNSGVLP
jgi:hypothetical protein